MAAGRGDVCSFIVQHMHHNITCVRNDLAKLMRILETSQIHHEKVFFTK